MANEMSLEEKWEKAWLENNFIFYHVFHNNPNLCKQLLEILLKIDIDRIEMQVLDSKDLPKRSRYYQALIDVDCLKSGQLYSTLKDSYIIFICMEDIFGQGLPLYQFENLCLENKNLSLGENTHKYFFIAPNCDKIEDKEQFAFFKFLTKREQNNNFTEQLAQMTRNAKINLQVRNKYMEYERLKAYARFDGLTEGRAEGLAEGRAEGLAEGRAEEKLKNAIIIVREFNQAPELVAEKIGIDLAELQKALSEK